MDPSRTVPATQLFSPTAKLRVAVVRRKFKRLAKLVGPYAFTERQRQVIEFVSSGRETQCELAQKLGVSQTTIHKHLFGNLVYHGKYIGERYGGVLAKMKRYLIYTGLEHEWEEFSQLTGIK